MSCFTNDACRGRITYAVTSHQNGRWEGLPLPELTHKALRYPLGRPDCPPQGPVLYWLRARGTTSGARPDL